MTDHPLDAADVLVRRAFSAAPSGLVTDLDGTISPIVDDPATATLVPAGMDVLSLLSRRLAVVAVVTGRAAVDARRVLGAARADLLIVGNHGLEWLWPGHSVPETSADVARLRPLLRSVLASVPAIPRLEVEDKGLSATIHYRRVQDPERARATLLGSFTRAKLPIELEVREGRRSVELRPTAAAHKGTAVAEIVDRFALRGLVVAGDDVTDLDMFRASHELRRTGVTTVAVAIAGGHEVPREVPDAADVVLESPDAFVRLLRRAEASLFA